MTIPALIGFIESTSTFYVDDKGLKTISKSQIKKPTYWQRISPLSPHSYLKIFRELTKEVIKNIDFQHAALAADYLAEKKNFPESYSALQDIADLANFQSRKYKDLSQIARFTDAAYKECPFLMTLVVCREYIRVLFLTISFRLTSSWDERSRLRTELYKTQRALEQIHGKSKIHQWLNPLFKVDPGNISFPRDSIYKSSRLWINIGHTQIQGMEIDILAFPLRGANNERQQGLTVNFVGPLAQPVAILTFKNTPPFFCNIELERLKDTDDLRTKAWDLCLELMAANGISRYVFNSGVRRHIWDNFNYDVRELSNDSLKIDPSRRMLDPTKKSTYRFCRDERSPKIPSLFELSLQAVAAYHIDWKVLEGLPRELHDPIIYYQIKEEAESDTTRS